MKFDEILGNDSTPWGLVSILNITVNLFGNPKDARKFSLEL